MRSHLPAVYSLQNSTRLTAPPLSPLAVSSSDQSTYIEPSAARTLAGRRLRHEHRLANVLIQSQVDVLLRETRGAGQVLVRAIAFAW